MLAPTVPVGSGCPPTEPQLTFTLICALLVNWLAKSCATVLNAASIVPAFASEVIELSNTGLMIRAAAGCAMLATSSATAAKPQRCAAALQPKKDVRALVTALWIISCLSAPASCYGFQPRCG